MLEVRSSGSPYEVRFAEPALLAKPSGRKPAPGPSTDMHSLQVGYGHGSTAKQQVAGSIAFYSAPFEKSCSMDWDQVCAEATKFLPISHYEEEMRGLADGAGVDYLDIIALNVRTEIVFGLWTAKSDTKPEPDGCTSVACPGPSGGVLLAQNWDWHAEQADNLIIWHISQQVGPSIVMVTEAGIIGKIGLNSHGVGVCLNAIRVPGVDRSRVPTHLALRGVLEQTSAAQAKKVLVEMGGTAGSSHILIADKDEAFGMECAGPWGTKTLTLGEAPDSHAIVHTNHLILNHTDVTEPPWLPDSHARLQRMEQLVAGRQSRASPQGIDATSLYEMFQDEEGFPCAINRCQTGVSTTETLFNIVMDLEKKEATVTFGRPGPDAQRVVLKPGN